MSVAATRQGPGSGGEPRHGVRIAIIWAVFTIIALPLVIWVLGPQMPPGQGSVQSSDQHTVNVVLLTVATPIVALIWVVFGYSVAVFRHRGEEIVDGPPIVGQPRLQITWLVVTAALVIGLAAYGTLGIYNSSAGAGGGQGPAPLDKPPAGAHVLQVQAIGQQWLWTFRYPASGGVETATIELPVDQWAAIHVTSLDVIHSFWAYELGVKADAVQGADNIAYVRPTHLGVFQVRCSELCGIWHGHMYTFGRVVSQAAFAQWVAARQQQYAGITKTLPPYSTVYYATPLRRG